MTPALMDDRDPPTPSPDPEPSAVRCPTCRALQAWSDACRRCRSDLRLLRSVADAHDRHRRLALRHLAAGRPREARHHARHCQRLRPGAESRRLLALAALLGRDWPAAAALARDRPGEA